MPIKLTKNQREVLSALVWFTDRYPDRWARPLDLGGMNGSFHGPCIFRLSKRGLCERETYRWYGGRRINKYKANDASRDALKEPDQ